jgi:hypothetical protein
MKPAKRKFITSAEAVFEIIARAASKADVNRKDRGRAMAEAVYNHFANSSEAENHRYFYSAKLDTTIDLVHYFYAFRATTLGIQSENRTLAAMEGVQSGGVAQAFGVTVELIQGASGGILLSAGSWVSLAEMLLTNTHYGREMQELGSNFLMSFGQRSDLGSNVHGSILAIRGYSPSGNWLQAFWLELLRMQVAPPTRSQYSENDEEELKESTSFACKPKWKCKR